MTAAAERPCYLHVGTHKTGTTSVQAFMAANAAIFAEMGVCIPRSAGNGDPGFACHHGIVRRMFGQNADASTGGLDEVARELAGSPASAAYISSEDISLLHDRPDLLCALRDAIRGAGFAPKIVLYVRPQVSYGVAIFAANVLGGYRVPFRTFVSDIISRGRYVWDGGFGPPFDYTALLDAFAAVFGHDALIVRIFRSNAPNDVLLRSFANIIVPQMGTMNALSFPAERANRTLTFAGVLRQLGVSNDFDEHIRFAPFTVRDLLRFWLRFAPANRRLSKRYGIRVPVFELPDLARAIPIRRTLTLTQQLRRARRALNADLRSR